MGRTSSAVKDRYNAKAYEEIKVRVSKGGKARIQSYAEAHGESVNGFINRAIDQTMERDNEMTDKQLEVIMNLVADKFDGCKDMEEVKKAIKEVREMAKKEKTE